MVRNKRSCNWNMGRHFQGLRCIGSCACDIVHTVPPVNIIESIPNNAEWEGHQLTATAIRLRGWEDSSGSCSVIVDDRTS